MSDFQQWNNCPVLLFTDFGVNGPYVGQMKARLLAGAPQVSVIDLMHDAPAFDFKASAYLLAALVNYQPTPAIYVCVVDPGVGGDRAPVCLEAGGNLFIGPDNGLFDIVAQQAGSNAHKWQIHWRPDQLSTTFHGRDLFAPAAARIIKGKTDDLEPVQPVTVHDWPEDLAEIIYCDAYGNAITGIRASRIADDVTLKVSGQPLQKAETFSHLPPGKGFWYKNSIGLVEIAVNQGSAVVNLGLQIGSKINTKLL